MRFYVLVYHQQQHIDRYRFSGCGNNVHSTGKLYKEHYFFTLLGASKDRRRFVFPSTERFTEYYV